MFSQHGFGAVMARWPWALAAALVAGACAVPALARDRPTLVVAIVVDQLSADLFDRYRNQFTGGFSRLVSQGVVFPSGYQGHAATETCPGASTILTGSHPARTGIVANNWIDPQVQRADKLVYCAENPDAPSTTGQGYQVSAHNLRVDTLGDRLKAADPASRVVAVAGKDRLAVMLGGHKVDQLWFWASDRFRTAGPQGRPDDDLPAAVRRANRAARAAIDAPSPRVIPQPCRDRIDPAPLFPAEATLPAKPRPGDVRAFRTSAALDRVTATLALDLADDMALGKGAATDVLAIGLAATDYVGHATGAGSAEMCAQVMALDRLLGDLLDRLEKKGRSVALVLTADHGAPDAPERSRAQGDMRAERIDPRMLTAQINAAIHAQLGVDARARFIAQDNFSDIYLDRAVIRSVDDSSVRPVASVANIARKALKSVPQVDSVLTADELLRTAMPTGPVAQWTLKERARASFDPMRSGDLILLLKPMVTPLARPFPGVVATHGSPWDYDRRVPILFWWPDADPALLPTPVQTVDILPTLAAMVGLAVPADAIDGRCLALAQEGAWPCGAP